MTAPRPMAGTAYSRGYRLGALLLAAALACSGISGCQALFAGMEMAFPKDRVPAKYKLPGGKKVLVFPDDASNPVLYPPVKRELAERLGDILKKQHLAEEVVEYQDLVNLQTAAPGFNQLSVSEVGKRLGAELVVYVNIDAFSLKDLPVDTLWRGRFACKVRVVDVRKGKLWPDEWAGYPLKVELPVTENMQQSYGVQLARNLAHELAVEIGQLFHEHYVERSKPKQDQPLENK